MPTQENSKMNIPKVDIKITSTPIHARRRKLNSVVRTMRNGRQFIVSKDKKGNEVLTPMNLTIAKVHKLVPPKVLC